MTQNSNLINKVDYTLLNPESTTEEILQLCEKATNLGVKSVCVLPKMVSVASEALKDSNVLVCTVVSFPHGTDTPEQKLEQTKQVISDGADEVDMVLNYTELKSTNFDDVDYSDKIKKLTKEVYTLARECHKNINKSKNLTILKVIVESGLLTTDETIEATKICLSAGADFIKTSTGMVSVGAEVDKVKIMRTLINDIYSSMKIKASGAIRTLDDMHKFEPYVDRFGMGYGAVDKIFSDDVVENIETY